MAITGTVHKNSINTTASIAEHRGVQQADKKGRTLDLPTDGNIAIGFSAASNSPRLPFAGKSVGFEGISVRFSHRDLASLWGWLSSLLVACALRAVG